MTTEFGAERGCPRCAAAFPNFAQLLAAEKPDAQFGRMVQEQCRKVIEWFAAAREKLPEGDVLLRECLRVGETKQEGDFTHRLAWPLARAQTILGELPPWALSESWGPVRHGQLRAVQRYDGEAEAELGEGAAGRLYRCIRRHIFRQYVRSHRDCLGTLRCCDREQSLSLNGAHVCTVSMTYLIWRMSVEGLANIEGLHYARKNPIYLRLMAPEGHASMPPLARAHWCYFGFFGIWEELTRLCSRLNFSVVQDSIPCSGHVLWKCAPVPRDYRSAHEEFDWHILYPDPEILTAMTHQRCLTIERSRILFGSIRPPWRQSPNGAPDGLRNLFKILHAEPMHSNEYRRLKV